MLDQSVMEQKTKADSGPGQPALIWTKNFVMLCIANFTLFMSTQMLFPVLPIYLLYIGGARKDVGYVMGSYTLCAMAIRPLAGWLVDRYGRKKVLIIGMITMLSVSVLYQLVGSVPVMMAVRGCHGIAFGIVSTALGTMVADSLPAPRLGEGMGYFGLTSSLSMSIAPVIGFWLVGKWGYALLFAGVLVLALLALGCSLPVRGIRIPKSTSGNPGISWKNFLEKSALPASGVMFFIAAVYGAVLSYISLCAVECGIDNIGLFFTAIAVAMLISRPISGRWSDRGGTNQVVFIGHLTVAIGMVMTGLSHTVASFCMSGAVLGVGFGFCIPTLQAVAVRPASRHRRGAATATFFAAFDLGIGLGAVIWGYAAGVIGYQAMFFSTLLPLALAGAIYSFFKDVPQQTSPADDCSS